MLSHIKRIPDWFVRVASAAVLVAAAWPAHASQVGFTGGFTSFAGPVQSWGPLNEYTRTTVNGVIVMPDRALPGLESVFSSVGLGYKDEYQLANGQTVPGVEFIRPQAPVEGSQPNPNSVQFFASPSLELSVGSVFTVGTFSLTNGGWFGNPPGSSLLPHTDFGFSITTHSSDPALDGIVFTDTLRFVVTSPNGTNFSAAEDADYFYFVNHPELGTMSVLESRDAAGNPMANTGSISLTMRIGSLIPVSLSGATGAAFVGNQISAVPELPTWVMFLVGASLAVPKLRRGARRARASAA